MGTSAASHVQPSVLCSYFQTPRGRTTSSATRRKMEAATEVEPLRSLVTTADLAHELRRCVEDEEERPQAKLL